MSISRIRLIATSVIFSLAIAPLSAPSAFASEESITPSAAANTVEPVSPEGNLNPELEAEAQQMESGLNYVMSIPEEVLQQGDAATQQWLRDNPINPAAQEGRVTTYASVLGCSGAILGMLGGNLVGAAKILKIRKYIDALGGVKDAVQLMWGASFSYEKMMAAGGALGSLAAELTGVASIKAACFN